MRLISVSAIYIILQGFILTVCAAPVNNYSDVNTTSTNTLQGRNHENRRTIKDSGALEELKGQGLSNTVTPSDPSQDTASPPATSTSPREERRSIKEKVHNALEALKGNTPSSGSSSNSSPDTSPDNSSSTTPPERRSRFHHENGRSIKEKLTHVVEALKGQGSSAVDSGSSQPDPTQSSSPAKRSFSNGRENRSIKEKLSNALAALEGPTTSSGDSSSSTPSEPSDTSSPSPTRRSLSRRVVLSVAVTMSEGEALTPFISPSQIEVRDGVRELLEAAAPSLVLGKWRLDWENIPYPKADAKSRIEFSMTGPEKCGGTCTAWVEEKKHEIKDHSGKVIYP